MAESIPRVASTAPPEELRAALEDVGCVIVEDLLAPELVSQLNADLDPFLEADQSAREFLNPGIAWFFGEFTRHATAISTKSRSFATDVLCHPTFMGVCDEVLRPACSSYQLNLGHALSRGPGAETQLLHRDELVWVHCPRPHPELQIASMIALVDFTRDNGATQIVPGSHRWPLERSAEEHEIAHAEMSAGSAAIYLGSTIHGGGANTTADQWRRGLHLSYVLGWLRTEENHYLATPPDVARSLPRRSQELLGYAAHDALEQGGGYLGTLDLRSPVDLFESGEL